MLFMAAALSSDMNRRALPVFCLETRWGKERIVSHITEQIPSVRPPADASGMGWWVRSNRSAHVQTRHHQNRLDLSHTRHSRATRWRLFFQALNFRCGRKAPRAIKRDRPTLRSDRNRIGRRTVTWAPEGAHTQTFVLSCLVRIGAPRRSAPPAGRLT